MTDIDKLQQWEGRTQVRHDVITAAPVAALAASLDLPGRCAVIGDALPACWHWLYFHDLVPTAHLTQDGHAPRGEFLPPVPLPRRMWAGSQLRFTAPLLVGESARRESTVASIAHKRGRSGDLVFVTVRHRVFQGDALALEEAQRLVYREGGKLKTAERSVSRAAPPVAQWSRDVRPDSTLLFRYSALTFNSHRIHYDREYAMGEEGYGGLVVQGPLTATLLLDLLHRELPAAHLCAFEFRAIKPLLANTVLRLQGRQEGQSVALWALDAGGEVAMEARADLQADLLSA